MKIRLTENKLRNIIRESVQQILKEGYADTHMGSNPFLGQGERETYGGERDGFSNTSVGVGDRQIKTIGDFVWALQNWFLPYADGSRKTTIENAIELFGGMAQNHGVRYYNAIQEGRFGDFMHKIGNGINKGFHNLLGIDTDEEAYDRTHFADASKMSARCKQMQRFIKSMFYKYQELGQGRNKYQGILRQLYNVIGSMRDVNPYRRREDFDDEWGNTGAADAKRYRELSQGYADRTNRGWNTRRTNQVLKPKKTLRHKKSI